MTDRSTSILERLERCEIELQASRGYIKAMEYGIHALIARHPQPSALAELWSHVLPELADEQVIAGGHSALYHAAFQQALTSLTTQIEGAARLGDQQD